MDPQLRAGPRPNDHPEITVVMPCYNAERYVRAATESVLRQTVPVTRLLAFDDGSTDDTRQILEELSRRDGRVEVIASAVNRGTAAATNDGLERASTDWVMLMDADDELLPDALENQLKELRACPDAAVVSGRAVYINAGGRELGRSLVTEVRWENGRSFAACDDVIGLMNPSTLVRRRRALEVGGCRPQFPTAGDVDLWTRLGDAGYRIVTHGQILLRCRLHSMSMVSVRGRDACLDCEWVRACTLARRAGQPEPDRVAFERLWNSRSLRERLKYRRIATRRSEYRRAGLLFGEGRPARALMHLACAFFLGPITVSRRLVGQLLR